MSGRAVVTLLRDERRLVAAVLVTCLIGAALAQLFLPRTYTSTAMFYAAPGAPGAGRPAPEDRLTPERVGSYVDLLKGPRVAADASQLLGGRPTPKEIQEAVSAEVLNPGFIIILHVDAGSPREAELVASAVGTAFDRLVTQLETAGVPVNRPRVALQIVLPPTEPTEASSPRPFVVLPLGLALGVVLGVGAAAVRHARRRAVETPEALVVRVGGPVLGVIPAESRPPQHPAVLADPPGSGSREQRRRADAHRRLRATVSATTGDRSCLVLAGAGPDQGTSTLALDLAAAFVEAGERVVLVDTDPRGSGLTARLGLEPGPGLREYLDGEAPEAMIVRRWAVADLDVVRAGASGPPLGDVLADQAAGDLLELLRERYDRVLVDTAGAVGAAHAIDLARHADGTIVVVRRGTAYEAVDVAVAALRLAGAVVVGAVLTRAVHVTDLPAPPRALPPPPRALPAPPRALPPPPRAAPLPPAGAHGRPGDRGAGPGTGPPARPRPTPAPMPFGSAAAEAPTVETLDNGTGRPPGPTRPPTPPGPVPRRPTPPGAGAPHPRHPGPGPDTAEPIPTAEGPTAAGPTAEGPTAEGPTAEGPTAEGPTAEGPTAAGPTAEGPTTPIPAEPVTPSVATPPGATPPGPMAPGAEESVAEGSKASGTPEEQDHGPPRAPRREPRRAPTNDEAPGGAAPDRAPRPRKRSRRRKGKASRPPASAREETDAPADRAAPGASSPEASDGPGDPSGGPAAGEGAPDTSTADGPTRRAPRPGTPPDGSWVFVRTRPERVSYTPSEVSGTSRSRPVNGHGGERP